MQPFSPWMVRSSAEVRLAKRFPLLYSGRKREHLEHSGRYLVFFALFTSSDSLWAGWAGEISRSKPATKAQFSATCYKVWGSWAMNIICGHWSYKYAGAIIRCTCNIKLENLANVLNWSLNSGVTLKTMLGMPYNNYTIKPSHNSLQGTTSVCLITTELLLGF